MSQHYHHMNQAFKEFEKSTKHDWIKKVKLEFSGKNIDEILSGSLREDLQIFPFYTEEDLPSSLPAQLKSDKAWNYHEYLLLHNNTKLEEANAVILQALNKGASGIDFQLQGYDGSHEDLFPHLLNQVKIQHCQVSFHLNLQQLDFFTSFLKYATGLDLDEKIRGSLYVYPDFNQYFNCENAIQSVAKFFSNEPYSNYHFLGISSAPFVNGGASVVQELVYTLSYMVACIDYLTDQGIELSVLFNHLEVTLNTQSNFFTDIAKFRAIRILLSQVAEAYQVKDLTHHHWRIKAVSGVWNKTIYDPVGNMLRNTTEAMGAVIGGCNILALIPHDFAYQQYSNFSSRIARNITNILQYEAQFGKVMDPAAGSFFLENLTHQLVEKSWQEFLSIEKEGGYIEAVKKGFIQQGLMNAHALRQKDIKTRRQPFVGSTRYANPEEHITNSMLNPAFIGRSNRGPSLFENLRLAVDHYVNQGNPRPVVSLIIFPQAQETALLNARLTFIKDLLVCSGMSFEEYVYEKGFAEQKPRAKVWILCSSNQFYDDQLPEVLKQSQDFQNKVLYVAGLPQTSPEALRDAGVRDMIYAGKDMHRILTDVLLQMGVIL